MLYYGKGCESNEEKAVEYLRKAVEEKNVPAILLLSNIYYEKGVVKEIPYMIEHLKELSDKADHIQAQYTLGKIYLKEGEFYNLEKGISYLERSASQGNEYAKYRLAKEYLNIDIGKLTGRASNTIRNELKRGTTTIILGYYEKEKYFPDTGQAIYEKNRKKCRKYMINRFHNFLNYIEEQLQKHKRSFASARAEAIGKRMFKEEEICSLSTLYSYTERGLLKVKNIDLPEKVGRRVKKKKNRKHKRLHGQSIEKRPESINDKKEFGHWEIDLVIGKKEKTDQVLLTLTERKTKKEIIRKISGKTVNAVHRCLKKLKKETPNFNKIFRSITADNGVEFSKLYEIGEKMGIDIYYAHPYSSWERGLNENTNRIIRRFIPKGHRIREYTKKKIEKVEFWINTMYRRSLGWKTAEECYQNELELLDAVVT